MSRTSLVLLTVTAASWVTAASCVTQGFAQERPRAYTTLKQARQDPDFALQGEYAGVVHLEEDVKAGLQLVALGNGEFQARVFVGGLPGDGWNGEHRPVLKGVRREDGSVVIESEHGKGTVKDGVVHVVVNGSEAGQLPKVTRKSDTLRAQPPAGAIVLFDGTSAEHWNDALTVGKLLTFDPKGNGATSKQAFGSHRLHIEFRLPYMPEARGQARGNSGLYLQSRYEVQMLDSFGLEGADNECGGIYQIARPRVNMCFPPMTWQTYDVDFTAAEYDAQGNVVKHPHITVRHNGVLIHENVELPRSTTASPLSPGPDDAPVYLQNHGNPVRYRNIWVQPKS